MRLRNPIAETINDKRLIIDYVNGLPLVPYYGNDTRTSFNTLKLLENLHELSPSAHSCMEDIIHYCFKGDYDVCTMEHSGFMAETEDLPYSDKLAFLSQLEGIGITIEQINDVTCELSRSMDKFNNSYLYIREYLGQYHIEAIHPMNLMLLDTTLGEPKTYVFSENFDITQFVMFKFKMIRKYPEWTEVDGAKETILHFTDLNSRSRFYGRSKRIAILNDMFAEYKGAQQRGKVSGSDFVATMILAFEQEDYTSDLQGDDGQNTEAAAVSKGKQINAAMTNKSDLNGSPDSILCIDYPHGGQAPTPIKMEVNRDHQYMVSSNEIAVSNIYANYGWFKELSGKAQSKGGIGANILKDLFEVAYTTVIQPRQDTMSKIWHKVFSIMIDGNDKTIKFPNLMENMGWNQGMADEAEDLEMEENEQVNDAV